jgi:transcriptional regulator with XRE-family HTH domain
MASPGEVWARKFERLLRAHPRADGRIWRGVDLDRATNGYINGSYVTALRKGRIEEPGLNKLRRISEVMGFPFQSWFEPLDTEPRAGAAAVGIGRPAGDSISVRLDYLFEAIPNDKTGEPLTEAEVARLSLGRLGEGDVRGMRSGAMANPSREMLLALCDVFDVDLSYWDERADQAELLDPHTLRALRDKESLAILHKSYGLPDEDKSLIMTVLDELARRRGSGGEGAGDGTIPS